MKNIYNLMTLSLSGSSKAIVASQKEGFPSRKRNRKAEAAAQSQAESIKKKGICHVPIRLAVLFSGEEIYLTESQQNLSSGFLTRSDTNLTEQPQLVSTFVFAT